LARKEKGAGNEKQKREKKTTLKVSANLQHQYKDGQGGCWYQNSGGKSKKGDGWNQTPGRKGKQLRAKVNRGEMTTHGINILWGVGGGWVGKNKQGKKTQKGKDGDGIRTNLLWKLESKLVRGRRKKWPVLFEAAKERRRRKKKNTKTRSNQKEGHTCKKKTSPKPLDKGKEGQGWTGCMGVSLDSKVEKPGTKGEGKTPHRR